MADINEKKDFAVKCLKNILIYKNLSEYNLRGVKAAIGLLTDKPIDKIDSFNKQCYTCRWFEGDCNSDLCKSCVNNYKCSANIQYNYYEEED